MLDFERAVVAALATTTDPRRREGIEAFVEGSLDDMPEFLRLGVLAETVAFATLWKLRRGGDLPALLVLLERSPIPLVRQYVRLFRSLVLFAEQSLTPAGA
jgi:hypothetical protein